MLFTPNEIIIYIRDNLYANIIDNFHIIVNVSLTINIIY